MFPIAYAAETAEAAESGIAELTSIMLDKLPLIGVALFILLISFFIGKIAKRSAQRAIVRSGRHEAALSFVGKTVYIGCIVLGLTVALKVVGVDLSFVVGALGFGLGFGLKSVLENYVAGLVLLVQEPFRVGDMVQIRDHFGRVEQIEARTTFIRLFDGQRVVIPNSDMTSQPVINYTTFPERRLTLVFGVAYDSDMKKVIQVALDALKKDKRILEEPPPIVIFNGYEESTIRVEVRYWIDNTVSNWLEMTSVGTQLVGNAFNENNIMMPYPVRTLSMNPLDSDDLYQLVSQHRAVSENRQN